MPIVVIVSANTTDAKTADPASPPMAPLLRGMGVPDQHMPVVELMLETRGLTQARLLDALDTYNSPLGFNRPFHFGEGVFESPSNQTQLSKWTVVNERIESLAAVQGMFISHCEEPYGDGDDDD